jgi:putative DNA primase/helicase
VPPKVLDQILVNPQYVPTVSGLSGHPLVTRSGCIIAAPGIDLSTRLLLYGTQIEGLRAYSKDEALKGIEEITRLFLEGFEFASPLDRAAALALLLTAVERKLMDMSPGFLITAAQQSLGKTTLARLLHCIVTGTDAPIFTCPDDDDVEVQKLLLSTLLRSPEIVVFDNVGDGLTFRSPALSAAMTSATKQGRLLGHNRDAVVSTSVVFILTGNNVGLANDEASRIIPIRLTTKAVSPHKRTFKYPDIVRRGLEIRETVLRHVIGLIAGYQTTSERVEAVPSRFPQWDALVRQPLMWAGLADVGTVFYQNIESSPELGAHLALMIELQKLYPEGKEFSASSLVRILDPSLRDPDPIMKEALLALRVKDLRSERSIGHCLSRVLGRNAVIRKEGEEDVVLFLDRTTKDGLSRYRVLTREREGGSL